MLSGDWLLGIVKMNSDLGERKVSIKMGKSGLKAEIVSTNGDCIS